MFWDNHSWGFSTCFGFFKCMQQVEVTVSVTLDSVIAGFQFTLQFLISTLP